MAAVVGLVLTGMSLSSSAENVKVQLEEQRHATSILIVSEFMTNVSDGLLKLQLININVENCNRQCIEYTAYENIFHRVLVTRTQLLIDSLEFPDLTAQILKFLGSNNLGSLFSVDRGFDNKEFIQINRLSANNMNISSIKLNKPMISCSNIKESKLRGSELTGSTINFTDLEGADLTSAKLISINDYPSSIYWSNFNGVYVSALSNLSNTNFLFSDLRGVHTRDVSSNEDSQISITARLLAKTRSLYGSKIDSDVEADLKKTLGKELYNKKRHDVFWALSMENNKDNAKKSAITDYKKQYDFSENNWNLHWKELRSLNCQS